MLKIIFINTFLFVAIVANGQNTFQKIYENSLGDAQCFGSFQTNDDGYIFTGVAQAPSYKIYMTKTDCEGNILWSNSYNPSSTVGNISHRVIETSDHGYLLAASIGQFGSYNIMVVKTNQAGATEWHKVIQGSKDDMVNAVIETQDHHYVLAGYTASWGQEANSPSGYRDVYVAKLDTGGNMIWAKTYGTDETVDEAFDIAESTNGGYAVTGRYIEQGTFFCMLLKTDTAGNMEYIRAYGDTNQHTVGYGIVALANGGFAITGSTTLTKTSYQDYGDEFIFRINALGDTLWCHSYHGTNIDGSETGSSIVDIQGQGFAIAVPTFSYPSTGFVPNKHVILRTDINGNMTMVRGYNTGSSHYNYLTKTGDLLGYIMSGFSNNYTTPFANNLLRMNNNFETGCNETNLLSLTVQENPPVKIRIPPVVIASGNNVMNNTIQGLLPYSIQVLCENIIDSCTTAASITQFIADESNWMQAFYNSEAQQLIVNHNSAQSNFSFNIIDMSGRNIESGVLQNNTINLPSNIHGIHIVQIYNKTDMHTFKIFLLNK